MNTGSSSSSTQRIDEDDHRCCHRQVPVDDDGGSSRTACAARRRRCPRESSRKGGLARMMDDGPLLPAVTVWPPPVEKKLAAVVCSPLSQPTPPHPLCMTASRRFSPRRSPPARPRPALCGKPHRPAPSAAARHRCSPAALLLRSPLHRGRGDVVAFHIWSAYSRIVLSDENLPVPAVDRILILVHLSWSR